MDDLEHPQDIGMHRRIAAAGKADGAKAVVSQPPDDLPKCVEAEFPGLGLYPVLVAEIAARIAAIGDMDFEIEWSGQEFARANPRGKAADILVAKHIA
jgi:hypothetical protein